MRKSNAQQRLSATCDAYAPCCKNTTVLSEIRKLGRFSFSKSRKSLRSPLSKGDLGIRMVGTSG